MGKNLIIELNKMKTLMGLLNEQGSADINIDRMAQEKIADLPDTPNEGFYATMIGQGTDYPTILSDYKTQVISTPYKNSPPSVKQSGTGVTAKDFMSGVQTDEKGNEYIVQGKKKYCLPNKDFWKSFTSGNYVYQIINPRNEKKFTMVLTTVPEVTVPTITYGGKVIEKKMKGYEASLLCQGGDNGWGFLIKDGALFWNNKGTAKDGTIGATWKSYNINDPEDFDLRSDFDIWWDEYGMWVEIGMGVLAAWAGAGLAGFLISSLELTGGLAAAYAGGSETILSVLMQGAVESMVMLPIANYQISRGMDEQAILNVVFCFLPFLTELGSVQKYIKGGIQPESASSLTSKLDGIGGWDSMAGNPIKYQGFLESLTGSELMLWRTTIDQLSTNAGQTEFKEALESYLKSNKTRITKEILGNNTLLQKIDMATEGNFSKVAKAVVNQNPITGGGLLGQFLRIGIPIAGVVVGFQSIYNSLKSRGYSDEQIEKTMVETKKALDKNEFFNKISKINQDLASKLTQELILKYYSSDDNVDMVLQDKRIAKALESDLQKTAVDMILKDNDLYEEFVEVMDIPVDINKTNEFLKVQLIDEFLIPNGYENPNVTDIKPLVKYKFTTQKIPNGEITINKQIKSPADVINLDWTKDVTIKTV